MPIVSDAPQLSCLGWSWNVVMSSLFMTIHYFAKIKTPKKDPVFTGPRGDCITN